MKKKKNKNWLVVGFIILLVVILIILIASNGSGKQNTSLNLTEKRWIEENKKEVINVSIPNDIPVFTSDGEGVFFDFIKKMEDKTELSFNLISYDSSKDVQKNSLYFWIVPNNKIKSLSKDAMVFYNDYYVLVGKDADKISDPSEISGKKIGLLEKDMSLVSFYLSSGNSYTSYDSISKVEDALKNNEVNYIAVPKTKYYNFIISNGYHIVYNITEIKESYVLSTAKSEDETLKSIVSKKFREYKQNYLEEEYDSCLSDMLLEQNNISEKSKDDFSKKTYTYGYIVNDPYSNMVNNRLIGLDSTYLKLFSDLTDATFTYKKFRSVKDLTNALNKGQIDLASSYYDFTELTGKYSKTISPYTNDYVVLVKKDREDVVINSSKSLKGLHVSMVKTTLANYFKEKVGARVTSYDRVKTLLSKINKNSIVIVDQNTYDLYKNKGLGSYKVIYNGKEKLDHGFIIKSTNENETFVKLFSAYMETINYKQIYNQAWNDYSGDSKEVSHGLIYFIIAVVVAFVIWLFAKKKIKIKRANKEDKIVRYIDPLTSLKNRHYLNKNFDKWEKNAIYPQAIIVINLNNLRHVNDVYGHEEGDKLLKQAANILIKNQLEQSDIIRTDGNEYLIYMVGYEKNKVVTYMRKLYKELGELPYGFGATLGYSMIEDDIKSIDDAINEAVLEIRASKEMKNNKK